MMILNFARGVVNTLREVPQNTLRAAVDAKSMFKFTMRTPELSIFLRRRDHIDMAFDRANRVFLSSFMSRNSDSYKHHVGL